MLEVGEQQRGKLFILELNGISTSTFYSLQDEIVNI